MKTRHVWKRAIALSVLAAGLWSVGVSPAQALSTVRPSANVAETIVVGMVDLGGIGTAAVVCLDAPGTSNDFYQVIGTSAGLVDDYQVYGDPTTGSSADTFYVVSAVSTNPGGYCSTIGSSSPSLWSPLSYNGNYLDFFGVGGGDSCYDGGGSNDTFCNGDAGNDYLVQESSIGSASGGAGADTVYGLSVGGGDRLSGGTDADCLWDSTNSFAQFDCGNNVGDVHDSRNTGTTGCPGSSVCCGLC